MQRRPIQVDLQPSTTATLRNPPFLIAQNHPQAHCTKCHHKFKDDDRYRIAGYFCWVQIFTIFADRPASAKIKTAKKMEIDDVITCVVEYPCERDGSLQSVCPLNGCCKEESACYCTKYQRNRKRRSEDVASTGRGVVRAFRVPRK